MIDALGIYRAIGYENIQQGKRLIPVLFGKPGRYHAQFLINNGEGAINAIQRASKEFYPKETEIIDVMKTMFQKYLPRTVSNGTESIINVVFDVLKTGKTKGQIKTLTMDEKGIIGDSKLDLTIGEQGIKIRAKMSGENSIKADYDISIANNESCENEFVQKKKFLEGLNYSETKEGVTGRLDFNINNIGSVKEAKGFIQAPSQYLRETTKKNFGFDIKNELLTEINHTEVQINDYQSYRPMIL